MRKQNYFCPNCGVACTKDGTWLSVPAVARLFECDEAAIIDLLKRREIGGVILAKSPWISHASFHAWIKGQCIGKYDKKPNVFMSKGGKK